jgi:glycosyltransferase involved in cell wall biosynthesis
MSDYLATRVVQATLTSQPARLRALSIGILLLMRNKLTNGREGGRSAPSISIVTPSFNQALFIGDALESTRLQNYPKLEHLVIDGLSVDGTPEVLHRLEAAIKTMRVKCVFERDSGQSEALNKGFRQAKGDIIGWLNADDRYLPGCFRQIAQAFTDYPEVDVFYGDYTLVNERGKTLRIRPEIEFNSFILRHHRVLYIATTATFFRRRIFDEGNWINETLHYAMDLDFFVRLAAKGYRFKHIPAMLADYRLQPDSKTCSAPNMQKHEHYQVITATVPQLTVLRSKFLRKLAVLLLRFIAAGERYTEKLYRGHYSKYLGADADIYSKFMA